MAWKRCIGWAIVAIGCGPAIGDDDAAASGAGTTDGAETEAPPDDEEDEAPTSDVPDDAPEWIEDEQLCIDFCTNLQGSECGRADESCYTWCLQGLQLYTPDGCEDIEREVLECEAVNEIDAGCESTACEDAYRRSDFCYGTCFHLDGWPGSGGSQTDCHWSAGCYDHEFEMICPVGAVLGPCSCQVDGEEIAQCEPEEELQPFECGGEELHVFTGCCRDAFGEVLLP